MVNTGKDFEKIVANIHRHFADKAQITENEQINGRQIDIAIRATIGVYPLLIIIECKDYCRKVDVGKVDELIGKIDDVKAAQGILVSNSGFSEGAINRAKKDGRIQLSSVVDIENGSLRARVEFPAICDFRAPKSYRFRIANSGIGQFRFTKMDVVRIRKHFIEMWNNGNLPSDEGSHEYAESDVKVGMGSVTVTYFYEVSKRLLFGYVPMSKGEGIIDITKGSFTSKDFTIDLDTQDVEKNWKPISEEDIPPHAFRYVALDNFLLPEE